MLPPKFVEQMRGLLGDSDFEKFEASLNALPPVSIRFNPRKMSGPPDPSLQKIGWSAHGFYLAERPIFTLDPSFHAGRFYVQEASSQFLETALRQTLDFSKSLKIIDLCAAPGGKSTLIASLLNDESLLVANEIIQPRYAILKENLERWGFTNVAATSANPTDFEPLGPFFDAVVVDAPCSGEGLFRKDLNARNEWSPEAVGLCAARQKRILAAAEKLVRPDGFLIFSTCTYNVFENRDNAAWLAQLPDFQSVKLNLESSWGVSKVEFEGGEGYQFFPHRTAGEGFFIAVFQKKGSQNLRAEPEKTISKKEARTSNGFQKIKPLHRDLQKEAARWLARPDDFSFFETPSGEVLALPNVLETAFQILDKTLKIKQFGVPIGEFKGRDFIPSHALALSTILADELPCIELSRVDALVFLKKENLVLENAPTGWTLACFEGLPLGWMKILPNRVNNYLPQNRRIRMEIH